MPAPGPVTITCPGCGEALPVPCRMVFDNTHKQTVLVRMNYAGARKHFQECAQAAAKPTTQALEAIPVEAKVPAAILAGRMDQLLEGRHFIGKGPRACRMCGRTNDECMSTLRTKGGMPCCAACGEGDSHPIPQQDMACAEWAVTNGAKD